MEYIEHALARVAGDRGIEIIDAPMVPLRTATLCMDCERIFAQDGGRNCPGCGSGALLNLAAVLDRRVK